MATTLNPGARRGNYGVRRRYQLMADINVTPMVDVMLVLLIIFMVTAPLLTVGVPLDLPKTQAESLSQPDEPLVVSVNAKGEIYLQETPIDLASLAARLIAITQNKPDTRIFVRGDQTINYGSVMQVLGTLNSAGFTHVALVTELPGGTPPADATEGQGAN
jgi:biopolymer transport protein TolR